MKVVVVVLLLAFAPLASSFKLRPSDNVVSSLEGNKKARHLDPGDICEFDIQEHMVSELSIKNQKIDIIYGTELDYFRLDIFRAEEPTSLEDNCYSRNGILVGSFDRTERRSFEDSPPFINEEFVVDSKVQEPSGIKYSVDYAASLDGEQTEYGYDCDRTLNQERVIIGFQFTRDIAEAVYYSGDDYSGTGTVEFCMKLTGVYNEYYTSDYFTDVNFLERPVRYTINMQNEIEFGPVVDVTAEEVDNEIVSETVDYVVRAFLCDDEGNQRIEFFEEAENGFCVQEVSQEPSLYFQLNYTDLANDDTDNEIFLNATQRCQASCEQYSDWCLAFQIVIDPSRLDYPACAIISDWPTYNAAGRSIGSLESGAEVDIDGTTWQTFCTLENNMAACLATDFGQGDVFPIPQGKYGCFIPRSVVAVSTNGQINICLDTNKPDVFITYIKELTISNGVVTQTLVADGETQAPFTTGGCPGLSDYYYTTDFVTDGPQCEFLTLILTGLFPVGNETVYIKVEGEAKMSFSRGGPRKLNYYDRLLSWTEEEDFGRVGDIADISEDSLPKTKDTVPSKLERALQQQQGQGSISGNFELVRLPESLESSAAFGVYVSTAVMCTSFMVAAVASLLG